MPRVLGLRVRFPRGLRRLLLEGSGALACDASDVVMLRAETPRENEEAQKLVEDFHTKPAGPNLQSSTLIGPKPSNPKP